MKYVIEFRNGSFLQSLDADHGGPHETAQRFDSKEAAVTFADENAWLYVNGGMVREVDPHEELRAVALAAIQALHDDALRIAGELAHRDDYRTDADIYIGAIRAIRGRAHR